MVKRIRAALTYANVVATLALFVALGGVSYAAVTLPARSVGTKQLKSGAVTSAKVRNGTLRARDFRSGRLPRGRTGPAGADGADGLPGMNGAAGGRGEPGSKGDRGEPGPAGAGGAPGPPGPPGSAGGDGPTGSTGPPGVAGASGAQGPQGPAGPAGPIGPTGAQGPSGVVSTARISGAIAPVSPADDVWQFLGPWATATTASGQRLTAAAMVPIATTGTPQTIKLDVCYQPSGGGALSAFAGGAFSLVAITQTRVAQAVAGTVAPGAGTWRVGACAQTAVTLDNNDFVNGYVQVTG